jgi:hypothetical protein
MSDNITNNYDDVFLRDLFAGVSYFMYDILSISKVVDDVKVKVKVPIYPSSGVSENFIKDFFLNKEDECGLPTVGSSIVNVLPSGRILLDESLSIDSISIINNNVSTIRNTQISNDFFDTFEKTYGRRTILSMKMSFVVSIKCTSIIERFKVLEKLIEIFYKNRVFYFSSCGVDKIPATMSINDSFNLPNQKNFKFGNVDKKYVIDVSFSLNTYMLIDNNREEISEKQKNGIEPKISIVI